jgi:hypothetical protein
LAPLASYICRTRGVTKPEDRLAANSGLIALTIVLFAAGYVVFQRQEGRA